MVKRRGLGATAAAAVIFSIILASNLALYASAQDRARLYLESDAVDSMEVDAAVLTAAGGASVLAQVARTMGANAFDCQNAIKAATALVEETADQQEDGGIKVTVTASLVGAGPSSDNMSMLGPFDGSAEGDLNILLRTEARGSVPSFGVSYSKVEVHSVHLPARLASAASDCTGAVAAIAHSLGSAAPANCTYSGIEPLMEEATRGPRSVADGDGFTLGVRYAVSSGQECRVVLSVSVEQPDVPFPGGSFTLRMLDVGTVSF